MDDLQTADPCFAARYRNMGRIDEIFDDIRRDLQTMAANISVLDFGTDYDGLDDGGIPDQYRQKLIPLLDWTQDIVRRTGGRTIPVHGDLHSYVKYPDFIFKSFVLHIEYLIRDLETLTATGVCSLNAQATKMREALELAQEEVQRECGDEVEKENDD